MKKTQIAHIRLTDAVEKIVKEYAEYDMRSIHSQLFYFICLGIYKRKVDDREIANSTKFNGNLFN